LIRHIAWNQIQEQLNDPRLLVADWSAHCGCVHKAGENFVHKCPLHAAGAEVVEAERK
jgi:hypothetical protein